MTGRKSLIALAVCTAAAIGGCGELLAPPLAPRVVRVGVVPLFSAAGALGDMPPDVDSVVITIHNPPAPDTSVGVGIAPGQDSIVITIDVPLNAAGVDTMSMGMLAIRSGPPPEVLYRADSVPLVVRVGVPTRADTMRARYVGPGAGILRAITIAPRSVALSPGGTLAFSFTAIDSSGAGCCATMPILWTSRAAAVARVGSLGIVTALADGAAWIVATSGASAAIRDSVEVVVASGPVATISASPATLAFSADAGQGDPPAQTVAVVNGGAGVLSGLAVSGSQYGGGQPTGWLTATLAGTTAPSTLTVQAVTGSLPPGTYTASIMLASAQAANSPLTLPVTFTVSPAGPAIGLSTTAVGFADTLLEADPAAQTVSVTNTAGGVLSGLAVGSPVYAAGQPTGWLTASLSGTTAPATVSLAVAKGALPAGTYTATVPVTSSVASNSPRGIAVTLTVLPALPAILSVSATTPAYLERVVLTFTGAGLSAPIVDTFAVAPPGVAGGAVQLPAGITLHLGVEGFDSAGVKTHQADTTVTLVPGANPAMTLVLAALSGDVTITWTFGSYTIVIAQPDTTLNVGDSLQYTATILDVRGAAVAGATPVWASTNPSIVSVDSSGLARALASGSARVVATYKGFAVSRLVTVR